MIEATIKEFEQDLPSDLSDVDDMQLRKLIGESIKCMQDRYNAMAKSAKAMYDLNRAIKFGEFPEGGRNLKPHSEPNLHIEEAIKLEGEAYQNLEKAFVAADAKTAELRKFVEINFDETEKSDIQSITR